MSRHPRGLLDTSVVIRLAALPSPEVQPERPMISVVTVADLSVGPIVARSDAERAARLAHVQQAEADFDAIPFDAAAARAFGRVAADLRGSGRKTSARTYDAMIAATALAHGLPIFTCNPADFTGITGLTVEVVV